MRLERQLKTGAKNATGIHNVNVDEPLKSRFPPPPTPDMSTLQAQIESMANGAFPKLAKPMLENPNKDNLRSGHLKGQDPHRKVRQARAALGPIFRVQNLLDVGAVEIKVTLNKSAQISKPSKMRTMARSRRITKALTQIVEKGIKGWDQGCHIKACRSSGQGSLPET